MRTEDRREASNGNANSHLISLFYYEMRLSLRQLTICMVGLRMCALDKCTTACLLSRHRRDGFPIIAAPPAGRTLFVPRDRSPGKGVSPPHCDNNTSLFPPRAPTNIATLPVFVHCVHFRKHGVSAASFPALRSHTVELFCNYPPGRRVSKSLAACVRRRLVLFFKNYHLIHPTMPSFDGSWHQSWSFELTVIHKPRILLIRPQ